ncbi:MAG: beta-propeller domain-containing protein [Candidatus Scatovivens sp.]
MNNKENYKKAIEQIHASSELKNKTFEKITQKKSKKLIYMKYLSACAVIIIIFSIVGIYRDNVNNQNNQINIAISKGEENSTESTVLPRFNSIEELKDVLKQANDNMKNSKDIVIEDAIAEEKLESSNNRSESNKELSDYSTTNIQVENVDEADIIKTDGEYIYYTVQNKVYIVKAEELKIISKIEIKEEKENFYLREIYINKDKLIILGNMNEYEQVTTRYETEVVQDLSRVSTINMAEAIVYDIKDKENPKQIRKVSLDGYYSNSRMIGDNIYFISNKMAYYYKDMEDYEILPALRDTAVSTEIKRADVKDIVYFEGSENYSYMIVAGFNINNNEKASTEIFFGASDIVYSSEKNLYIAQTNYGNYYDSSNIKTTIYKFNLNNSKVTLQCKGEIKGNLNNQFSIDEYDGKLRISTTLGFGDDSTNQLYILDENLNEIGKIENMAKGEKIYSVRFIGKIGYVVTFKQMDPLFVIDLSEPSNPQVKGELKIPGYSSYLHPYDETHIIGIGYNTKTNSNGGVTSTNMKMSMFDVSDLENPKEIFNVDIGKSYTYSSLLYNHKQLFYNKNKNLIGFPLSYEGKSGFVIYKIDLENGFEKYGEILQKNNYRNNFNRAIYIKDILYTLSETQINSYNLNNFEKISELILN